MQLYDATGILPPRDAMQPCDFHVELTMTMGQWVMGHMGHRDPLTHFTLYSSGT